MSRYPARPPIESAADDIAGRRISQFAAQSGISQSMVKLEIRRGAIKIAKVGRATIILTQPAQYLADRAV
jgi:hypothetical protein